MDRRDALRLMGCGLAADAAIGRRIVVRWPERTGPALASVVTAQALSALCLPLLFAVGAAEQIAVDAVFALAAAWLGCLVGLSFPLAVSLLAERGGDAARVASRLYALDLCGAAAGAVLIGAIAIPAVGIGQTSHVLAAVVLCALPPVGIAAWGRGRSG